MTRIYLDRNYLRMLPDSKLTEMARVLAERLEPGELYHTPHAEYAEQRTRRAL